MPELVWDGKYETDGKKAGAGGVAVPRRRDRQRVGEVRDMMLDLYARNGPTEWRYLKVPQKGYGKLELSDFSDLVVLGP